MGILCGGEPVYRPRAAVSLPIIDFFEFSFLYAQRFEIFPEDERIEVLTGTHSFLVSLLCMPAVPAARYAGSRLGVAAKSSRRSLQVSGVS